MVNERMQEHQYTLSELNYGIKRALDESFPAMIWVKAEISELKQNRTGHCYLELVESDSKTHEVLARVRGTIWAYTYRMLRPYFETTTGQAFTDGINVLLKAKVEFHPVFGLSLNIRDIDPTYTMGDLVRKRREILQQLEQDGVLEMNKGLELPLVAQRIAIISSPTAAGLQDFLNQLKQNSHQFCFYPKLFPAVMQGKDAASSIKDAMDLIFEYEDFFDVVVIIRGGGSQIDLACFDDYDLAFYVTQFPIPVLTGIGHDKDESVVDLVAHTKLKTPTAVAEFLISGALAFEQDLAERETDLKNLVQELIDDKNLFLHDAADRLKLGVNQLVQEAEHRFELLSLRINNRVPAVLKDLKQSLRDRRIRISGLEADFVKKENYKLKDRIAHLDFSVKKMMYQEEQRMLGMTKILKQQPKAVLQNNQQHLNVASEKIKLVDPLAILRRGYSVTYVNGKLVRSANDLKDSDQIEVKLKDGEVLAEVKQINKDKHDEEINL